MLEVKITEEMKRLVDYLWILKKNIPRPVLKRNEPVADRFRIGWLGELAMAAYFGLDLNEYANSKPDGNDGGFDITVQLRGVTHTFDVKTTLGAWTYGPRVDSFPCLLSAKQYPRPVDGYIFVVIKALQRYYGDLDVRLKGNNKGWVMGYFTSEEFDAMKQFRPYGFTEEGGLFAHKADNWIVWAKDLRPITELMGLL